MKRLILLSILALVVAAQKEKNEQNSNFMKCSIDTKSVTSKVMPSSDWIDIKESCVHLAKKQIRMEFSAALAYLQLGAYFSQFDVNRPGFSAFFFNAASEERSHAIKIMDYLLMRGQFTTYHEDPSLPTLLSGISANATSELISLSNALKNKEIPDGLEAFDAALGYEVAVTRSIKNIIEVCESEDKLTDREKELKGSIAKNDYHMVDWLITDLLDEQLRGQRELAGRISTLYKMREGYGKIADFLYDKKLLEEINSKAA